MRVPIKPHKPLTPKPHKRKIILNMKGPSDAKKKTRRTRRPTKGF